MEIELSQLGDHPKDNVGFIVGPSDNDSYVNYHIVVKNLKFTGAKISGSGGRYIGIVIGGTTMSLGKFPLLIEGICITDSDIIVGEGSFNIGGVIAVVQGSRTDVVVRDCIVDNLNINVENPEDFSLAGLVVGFYTVPIERVRVSNSNITITGVAGGRLLAGVIAYAVKTVTDCFVNNVDIHCKC